MKFVDYDICHRIASLQKLYSVIFTHIFDFNCLKYVKFVRFRMLPEAKIMKKYQQYTFRHLRWNGVSNVFLLRELDPYVRFRIFKMCEIRSFS